MSQRDSLHERARRVIPGGVSSGQRAVPGIEDLVVVAASGATFTDDRGKTYVDYHTSFGPQILGHADPDVDAAAAAAARRVDLIGVGATDLEIELAERIVGHFDSIEQVLLTSSGSEATFHAIRLARAVTGRRSIVKFQGCYHGWHDAVALNVISAAERVGQKDPLGRGQFPEVIDATIVCPFNDLEAVEAALAGNDVAAIILEPIPHNVGALLPEPGFLEGLRALCDRTGTLLVFDEVITGIRHSLGGFQEISGVRADLTTLGKAIANGYPLGALGGPRELMEQFTSHPQGTVQFAGTYNGHPAVCAAALATLDKLEQEPVHEHIYRLGERARTELAEVYARLGIQAFVSGFGSVFVTYFLEPPVRSYDDLLRNDAAFFVDVRLELVRQGIFELPLNLKRSHASWAHTDEHIDQLVEAHEEAAKAVVERRAAKVPLASR
jgi:glutamate-1-semialdehyde 2,1-aminomutase